MSRQPPRNKTPDPAFGMPRGRPPVAVVVLLSGVALTLHGCLLDGLPGDAADLPLAATAVPVASPVQVRSLPDLAERAATHALVDPVAHEGKTDLPIATLTTTPKLIRVEAVPQVPDDASEAAASVLSAVAAEPAAASEAAADASVMPASASAEASPAVSATAAAASPPQAADHALRQVERSVPTYKTHLPPAAVLVYDIRRGMFSGTGELNWHPQAGRYEARLQVSIAGFNVLTQVSQGGFDTAGLAPTRFTDQRARRAARAANFQRDAGKITYSDSSDEYALPGGSQDRLSWMIQLPAVLAAEPKRAVPGGQVQMVVSGVRADVAVWSFAFVGAETIESGGAKVRTLRFTRTPQGPRDVLADVWLDPARNLFPVRAVLSHGDDGDTLELSLRQINLAGKP
jgi:Protein of unknown function (DUF3108)